MKKIHGGRGDAAGNALFYILIAIALLAALTYAISDSTDGSQGVADYAVSDEQVSKLLNYSAAVGSTLHQMVIAGAAAETLYTTLSVIPPSDVGFPTAPHRMKIYHPMGGGLSYMTSTGPASSADTAATDFKINKASIVDDVGETDAVIGDILFTAIITSQAACQRINKRLSGSTAIPVLATASFNDLFTAGNTVTISAANCAACVGVAQTCVNDGGAQWGFYSALFPG